MEDAPAVGGALASLLPMTVADDPPFAACGELPGAGCGEPHPALVASKKKAVADAG